MILSKDIENLTRGSHKIIQVQCDICKKNKDIEYRTYFKITNGLKEKYYCHKCSIIKMKKTNLEKYGEIYPMKNKDILNKMINTNLEKYGVKFPSQLDEYKEKQKNTNLDKYGAECVLQNKEYFNKGKSTMVKNYGVEYPTQNHDIKKRIEKTNLERHGVKNTLQNKEFRKKGFDKLRHQMLEKNNILKIDGDLYTSKCDKGDNHNFEINKYLFYARKKSDITLCTICNPLKSYWNSEQESNLKKFIEENYSNEIIINSKLLSNNELDIFLPDLKLAFEFNGLYWHNELYKSNTYHLNKTEECEKNGIQLIHIYEDDWLYKQDIVKSRILNLLGKSNKIYARNCDIKEIFDNKLIKDFLEKNHIQGFIGSKIKIGLFYKDEIVSLMTFGNLRKSMGTKSKENYYEMIRFCNKLNTNVIGGASKLFKYFIKNYNPIEIISYADRSWSQGKLYERLGFSYQHTTSPNYYYIIGDRKFHRFHFRKDKLIKNGDESNKTEHQIMFDKKIFRIYDSGSLKYKYIN